MENNALGVELFDYLVFSSRQLHPFTLYNAWNTNLTARLGGVIREDDRLTGQGNIGR